MTKLHIGCGSVYLRGYVNVDVAGPNTFLAKDRPDLVEKLETLEDMYYARHEDKTQDKLREGPLEQEMVVDCFGSFLDLPAALWSIDELLARHVFEHLSANEARKALDEVDRKMKPGGVLRIDVPDHQATLEKLLETKDNFYIRHLLGPRKNEYGYHMMSYTKDRLKKLVEEHGFVFEKEEPNIHFYPAFCLRFRKPGARASYEYFQHLIPKLDENLIVGEVGPGANPFPRANVYIDISENHLNEIKDETKEKYNYDISKRTPFADNYFDYLIVSHVVEHIPNLKAAVEEIGRIAKRGIIIAPNLFKEFLFDFEEEDHIWWFMPTDDPKETMKVMRPNFKWMDSIKNPDYMSAVCRLFRTGPTRLDEDQRTLREWFYRNEAALDTVHVWEGVPSMESVK